MKKAEAKQEVAHLVSKLTSLTKGEFKKYDEENTKKDFILPLFRALGWATEDRQEVTAEDKVSRRRVDYAFRIEGIPKFFLEAKPLKADLDNPEYAWQAINYAWTKGVTWAVLTDFEGLKVFNAQWKGTNLLYNLFKDIPYTGYVERFDELWLLSRQSFEKSLLDIEAEKVAKKGKREPVGKELFDDLIVWRQRLYRQLRGWNKGYSEAQIDEAVQRILDRLIFIRTAEDRELEERVLLPAVREWRENGHRKELDKALVRIFREFDKEYDSELFETGHFCEGLACDSNTYALVIEGLYGMRDEVPTYNFDAIDVDVLGGIYEQYLSYRQGLPEEVEEAKRARRKKRGIYYTPKFVVQYIVENTVGRLLQERSHDEIRKLRILDPACGSGSFLIEAFDRLDRYHQEARGTAQRSDEKAERDDFLERLRILRENIYGVDLDPQAVEIARLNLLLKSLYQRALLPKLEDNIRCGNSLISGLPIELSQYFGPDWEAKRPFNWEEEFPKIMEEGGFDIVIGNPPYGADFSPAEKRYMKEHCSVISKGKPDSYLCFLEKAVSLLRNGGYCGFIIPNAWLTNFYGRQIRQHLLKACKILHIVDLFPLKVFSEAIVDTVILIVQREPDGQARSSNNVHINICRESGQFEQQHSITQQYWEKTKDHIFSIHTDSEVSKLMAKMEDISISLASIAELSQGIIPYKTRAEGLANPYISPDPKDPEWKPLLDEGACVDRYSLSWRGLYIRYGDWLWCERDAKFFEKPKLLFHRIRKRLPVQLVATFDDEGYHNRHALSNIIASHDRYSLKYILGLFNSKLLNFWFVSKFGLLMEAAIFKVSQLPIRRIDFDNPQDVKMHDDLVALVERMLDLHKRLKEAEGEEKKDLERQIARTDPKIDGLVYELYGITEREKSIIERG